MPSTSDEAKAALKTALLDTPAVNAVVARRVYPDQAASKAIEPYLVFAEREARQPKNLKGERIGIRRSRFEIAAACRTRQEAANLGTALEALLDGKVQQLFGNLLVKASRIDDDGVADDDEVPLAGVEFGDRTVRLFVIWWY